MSGICGIINFDGAPVDPKKLEKMANAAILRGPDGVRYWIDGNVGFVHLALNTTPESLREEQPLHSADGAVHLVADARVDNRDELISTLTTKGYIREKQPTDADLILAAYLCWGKECPKFIIGDFAFAIWDARERKLFCARDPIGVRLLHYYQRNKTLFFGSRIASILAGLGEIPSVNRAFLQDMLAGQLDRWIDETAYEGIRRIPPSYSFMSDSDGVSLQRYWILGSQPALNYKTDEEYIEHFRELFQDAVQVRLRSVSPVGVLVSGGLDSSSIAVMAEHLIDSGKASVPVHMYSAVFEQTPTADEREYVEAVVTECSHLKSMLIPCDDCWGFREFGADGGYPLDEPEFETLRFLTIRLLRQSYQDGCRVVLSGFGGDEVFAGTPYCIPSALLDIDLKHLPEELPFFLGYSGYPIWVLLARAYLHSLLPYKIRNWVSRTRILFRGEISRLAKPLQLEPNFPRMLLPSRLTSRSAEFSYEMLTRSSATENMVASDSCATYSGIEYRFPFFDRRIVDSLLVLPPRLRFRGGYTKYLLRRALITLLPKRVLNRTSKVHFGELENRGIREKERSRIEALLEDSQIVRTRLADSRYLLTSWASYWRSTNRVFLPRDLAFSVCSEAWLRHLEKQAIRL